jgi:hypothetical protein
MNQDEVGNADQSTPADGSGSPAPPESPDSRCESGTP